MGRRRLLGGAVALALAALGGCGDRADGWDDPLEVVGPVEAAGHLTWLNRSARQLVAIDPAGDGPPIYVQVAELPRAVAASSGGAWVLGGRGDAPTLDLVELPAGTVTSVALGGAYDRMEVSPDRRFAVLFFDPSVPGAPGGPAARNNNEVTVVDFSDGSAELVALRTESIAPRGVVFAPQGTLAAVVLDSALSILDLAEPQRNVRVPLKLSSGNELTPEEAIFSADARYLYVRTRESDDVLSVELTETGDDLEGFLNFLFVPGASGLADIVVPAGEGFERAVVALWRGGGAGGSLAALLDATGDESRTHLARLTRAATHVDDLGSGKLLVYQDPDPTGNSPVSRYVAGWDPLGDRVEEDLLPGAPASLPRIGAGIAFFPHESVLVEGRGSVAALTGVTLALDGARMKVNLTPIELSGDPTATALDAAQGRLFLGVSISREDSGAAPDYEDEEDFGGKTGSLVVITAAEDPDGGAEPVIQGLVLDDTIDALGVVGDHLFALHPGTLGDVTFVPRSDLSRAAAIRYDGFLGAGLLDAELEPEEE